MPSRCGPDSAAVLEQQQQQHAEVGPCSAGRECVRATPSCCCCGPQHLSAHSDADLKHTTMDTSSCVNNSGQTSHKQSSTSMALDLSTVKTVLLHERRDLWVKTADLLNATWHRSQAARLVSLEKCCSDFPCGVTLVSEVKGSPTRVLAFAMLSRVCKGEGGPEDGVLIESVVVAKHLRGQGFGKRIMCAAEEVAQSKGLGVAFLSTHDKQGFYSRLGYEEGEPVTAAVAAGNLSTNQFQDLLSCLGGGATTSSTTSAEPQEQPKAAALAATAAKTQVAAPLGTGPRRPSAGARPASASKLAGAKSVGVAPPAGAAPPPPPPPDAPVPVLITQTPEEQVTWMMKRLAMA